MTAGKREDETWAQWAARLHDERHGPVCGCPGNPGRRAGGMPLPPALRTLDTVPEGLRVEVARDPDCDRCDRDAHWCPGCGEPLAHGTEVCAACAAP